MARQDDEARRAGTAPQSDGGDRRSAQDIPPPDPPVVPESTDAEAAGTPPNAATRALAPDSGARTRRMLPVPREPRVYRLFAAVVLLPLALVVLVALLLRA